MYSAGPSLEEYHHLHKPAEKYATEKSARFATYITSAYTNHIQQINHTWLSNNAVCMPNGDCNQSTDHKVF